MAQALLGDWLAGGEHDGSLRAMPADEFLGSADLDEAAVFDDRHPVAQPLGLPHESGVRFVSEPEQLKSPVGIHGFRVSGCPPTILRIPEP